MLLSLTTLAKDYNMLTIGDSLSHGIFAGSGGIKTTGVDDEGQISGWQGWLIDKLFAAPRYVYSDGDKIDSIRSRLEGIGYTVNAVRYAKAGATTEDVLKIQVEQAIKSGLKFDGVYLLIGANDTCQNINHLSYIKSIYQTLEKLKPITNKIYVTPLPKIQNLYETVYNKRNRFFIKCEKVWKITDMCKRLTYGAFGHYEENDKAVRDFNMNLELLTKDAGAVYAKDVEEFDVESKYVSNSDCFHISRAGHEKLADLVWPYVK